MVLKWAGLDEGTHARRSGMRVRAAACSGVVPGYWLWQDWFNSDEKMIGRHYSFRARTAR